MHRCSQPNMRDGDTAESSMDLIAHWLKDEQGLQTELHQAMLVMGQQLHETAEAEQWPLSQWQSWLEHNNFDLGLLQQALQQLFANAGEAEPYAAICQELNQKPDDGPGIEQLLSCAEHHSEQLVPQLLEQLEAEAKKTEELLQTSGGSSNSHHKLAQNMSNHRAGWSAGGTGAIVLGGLTVWAYRTRSARKELRDAIDSTKELKVKGIDQSIKAANEALASKMPSTIKAAQSKLEREVFRHLDYSTEYAKSIELTQPDENKAFPKSALKKNPRYPDPRDPAERKFFIKDSLALTPAVLEEAKKAKGIKGFLEWHNNEKIEQAISSICQSHEEISKTIESENGERFTSKWKIHYDQNTESDVLGAWKNRELKNDNRTQFFDDFKRDSESRLKWFKDKIESELDAARFKYVNDPENHGAIIDKFINDISKIDGTQEPQRASEKLNSIVDGIERDQELARKYLRKQKLELGVELAKDENIFLQFKNDCKTMMDDNGSRLKEQNHNFFKAIIVTGARKKQKRDKIIAKWKQNFPESDQDLNDLAPKVKFNQYHGFRNYNSLNPDFKEYKKINWTEIEKRGQKELEENGFRGLKNLDIDLRQMKYRAPIQDPDRERPKRQKLELIDPPLMGRRLRREFEKAQEDYLENVNLADSDFLKSDQFKSLLRSALKGEIFLPQFIFKPQPELKQDLKKISLQEYWDITANSKSKSDIHVEAEIDNNQAQRNKALLPEEYNDNALKHKEADDLQKQLDQLEVSINKYDSRLLGPTKGKLEEERDKIKSELKALETESKKATDTELKMSEDQLKTANNKINGIEIV